jgi:hypothetical protein
MPIDLNGLVETLQRALGEIPPVAIALALLAGPTAALIGYRLISVARRPHGQPLVEIAPLWVCQECRSVNQLRLSRCYRCGVKRDAPDEIEVVLDQPSGPPATFEVPLGSPFAARGGTPVGSPGQGPGRPVMADPSLPRPAIAVGPGTSTTEARVEAPGGDPASAVERLP